MNKYLPLSLVLLVTACGGSGSDSPSVTNNATPNVINKSPVIDNSAKNNNKQNKPEKQMVLNRNLHQETPRGSIFNESKDGGWPDGTVIPSLTGGDIFNNYWRENKKLVGRIVYDRNGQVKEKTSGNTIKILNEVLPKSIVEKAQEGDIYHDWLHFKTPSIEYTRDILSYDREGVQWVKKDHQVRDPFKVPSDITGYVVEKQGAFFEVPVYTNKISVDATERILETFELGIMNGYKQAYLMLSTWAIPAENKIKHGMYLDDLVGYSGSGSEWNRIALGEYGINNNLKATYKGLAYSSNTGRQDGSFSLNVAFDRGLTLDGSVTGRKQDGGRDIIIPNTTLSDDKIMADHYVIEPIMGDIKGRGQIRFGGAKAEEVGGILRFETEDNLHQIGIIGKRDTSKDAN